MRKVDEKKYQILSRLTTQEVIKLQILLENKEIEDLKINEFSLQYFDEKTLKILEDYQHLKVANFVIQKKSIPFFVKLILGNKLENITLNLPKNKDCLLIFQALNENIFIENLTIFQEFEKEELESIQKLLNGNTNLKSIEFQYSNSFLGDDLDISCIVKGIQDNYSIQSLSLNSINVKQKEFSFFNKFKSLKTLRLKFFKDKEPNYGTNIDEMVLDSSSFSQNQSIIENPFNFSKLSIKKFSFSSSTMDNKDMIYLMKSLKDVPFFEDLDLGYAKILRKNIKDNFFEWIEVLKEILVDNKNLKSLNVSNLSLQEQDFEILCEGFEKNDSLTSLDIEGNKLGKCTGLIGKILKSKVNLNDLYIGDFDFNFNEFMKEFQYQENIKFFYLTKCKLDNESDELISNFLLNNRNMYRLTLYVKYIETVHLFKALDLHKKIKAVTLDLNSSIPGKYVVDLVKNNSKFEHISFSYVVFDDKELKEYFEVLSKDFLIKSFNLFYLQYSSSIDIVKMIEEYLFYNCSLIEFHIDEFKSVYCKRNKEFITNYYKIKDLKLYDVLYSFK